MICDLAPVTSSVFSDRTPRPHCEDRADAAQFGSRVAGRRRASRPPLADAGECTTASGREGVRRVNTPLEAEASGLNTPRATTTRTNDADRAQGAFSISDRPDPEMTRRDGDEGKARWSGSPSSPCARSPSSPRCSGTTSGSWRARCSHVPRSDFTSSQAEVAVGLNFISAVGAIGGGVVYNRHGAVKCVKFAMVLYAIGSSSSRSRDPSLCFSDAAASAARRRASAAICPQYIAEISPSWRRPGLHVRDLH